jgi:hypothetical protein
VTNTSLVSEILVGGGVGSVIGGSLAAVVTGLFGRGVNSAHTAQVVTDMYAKANEGNEKKIARLDAELVRLEAKLERAAEREERREAETDRLHNRVAELVALVRDDLIPALEGHGLDTTRARAVLGRPF